VAWRAFLVAGVAATIGFALAPVGSQLQAQFSTGLSGAAVLALALSVRRRRPEPAAAWRVLVVGAFLYWVSITWSTWTPLVTGRPVAFPSVPDLLELLAYAGLAAFLTVVVRRHDGEDGGEVLDVVVVAAGVASVIYELVFAPLAGLDLSVTARLTAFGYLGLLGLVIVAGLRAATVPARPRSIHALLVGWLSVTLVLEILYLVRAFGGAEVLAGRSAAWPLAYTLLGAIALHPDLPILTTPAPTDRVLGRRARTVVLAAAAVSPLVAMTVAEEVLGYARDHRVITRVIVMLIVVAIVARLGRSVGDLAEEQRLRADSSTPSCTTS
jgi:hypothetical protein